MLGACMDKSKTAAENQCARSDFRAVAQYSWSTTNEGEFPCKHLNVKIVLQNQTHERCARRIFVVIVRCVIPILKWSVIRLLNL
jgi:hypothetical protein